jgi:hypothetical protein
MAWLAMLAACGGGSDGSVDAPVVPTTVKVTGTATERSASGSTASAGVLIEAFANTDENTVVTSAMTDAQGNYTLTITSTGAPLDGYLRATKSGLLVTYLYPAEPLAADFSGASVNMISQSTFDTLANTLCRANQESTKGTIAVLVEDASAMPIVGATVASSPAATKACYDGSLGLPISTATATAASGLGYLFNVTGDATVSASKSGSTFLSHAVKARAGTFTTTLVHP